MLADDEGAEVSPDLILAAAGQANQHLGEALQRAVAMYNLMSGLLNEFVTGIETIDVVTESADEAQKEDA